MRHLRYASWLTIVSCGLLAICFVAQGTAAEAPMLESDTLGSTPNVHSYGPTLLCGQPSEKDLAAAKQRGIQVVLTLRGKNEIDWDEKAVAEQLGLQFERVDFRGPDTLTDEVFGKSRQILREAKMANQPVMLHCGSANRVGAIWMVYRVLDEGISWDQAYQEAKDVGLRTDGYVDRAKEYVQAQK